MNLNHKLIVDIVNKFSFRFKVKVFTIEDAIKFYRDFFKNDNLYEIYIPDDNGICRYYIEINNINALINFFEFNAGAVDNFTIFQNINKS